MAIYIVRSATGQPRQRSGTRFLVNAWTAIDTSSYGDSGAAILADHGLTCLAVVDANDVVLSDGKTVLNSAIIHTPTLVEAETPAGLVNGSNVTYTLAHAPAPASGLNLYKIVAGVTRLLVLTTDYTLSGLTVTFVVAPASGTVLVADYRY